MWNLLFKIQNNKIPSLSNNLFNNSKMVIMKQNFCSVVFTSNFILADAQNFPLNCECRWRLQCKALLNPAPETLLMHIYISNLNFMNIFFTILLVFFLCSAHAATYYFSSVSGDDSRTSAQAQSASTPWKSLSKLNSFFGQPAARRLCFI
jgi:hypothetical protein